MSGRTLTGRSYLLAWIGLILLSLSTLLLSFAPLGGWHVGVALIIAGVKATIIVLVFMHLIEQPSVMRMVLVVALLLIAILIVLTAADVATRHVIERPPITGGM